MKLEILMNNPATKVNKVIDGILLYCFNCGKLIDKSGWRHICKACSLTHGAETMKLWRTAIKEYPELKHT